MLRLKITNLILEESRKGFGTIIAKGILFLLPLYLYFPRNFTESNFKPFNDDSFNLDLALEFRRGEYSLLEYLLKETNGALVPLIRVFYLILSFVPEINLFFLKQILLTMCLLLISIILFSQLLSISNSILSSVLLVLIFQVSHVTFQLTASLAMYIFTSLNIIAFLLLFREINENNITNKFPLLTFLLATITNFNLIIIGLLIALVILKNKELKRYNLSSQIDIGNVNVKKGLGVYAITFALIEFLNINYSSDSDGLQISIFKHNLKAIFDSESPISPYGYEYGNQDVNVFVSSFANGIYNWILPGYISDDIQPPFWWIPIPALVITLVIIFLLFLGGISRYSQIVGLMIVLSGITYAMATYLGRGFGFAWHHIRYQPLLPFLTMLLIGSVIAKINQLDRKSRLKTRLYLNLMLFFTLILNTSTLVNSERYETFLLLLL